MKKFIALLGLIIFCLNPFIINAATDVGPGDVYGNWTKTGSPYQVTGEITVPSDSLLSIEPGVEIVFQTLNKFQVDGHIMADGDAGDTIIFRASDPGTGWRGLFINYQINPENNSVLDHCKFTDINYSDQSGSRHSAVNVYNNSFVTISNCLFTKGLHWYMAAIYINSSDISIYRTTVYDNDYSGITAEYANLLIEDSYICNNPMYGITLRHSDAIITNCIVSNNSQAMNLINSDILVTNSIFGYSIIGPQISRSEPVFRNCIFWGHQHYALSIADKESYIELHHCNIEGGQSGIEMNDGLPFRGILNKCIDSYPQFADPPDGYSTSYNGLSADWHLPPYSPSVNTGEHNPDIDYPLHDLEGQQRISHGIIDIGPYEFHNDTLSASDTIHSDTYWIADSVFVTGDIFVPDSIKLTIAPGTYVEMQGSHQFDIDGSLYAIGTDNSPIVFTIHDTTHFEDFTILDGGWRGFEFFSYIAGNDTSRFGYCHIQYVKRIEQYDSYAAIECNQFNPVIVDHCLLIHNKGKYGSAITAESSSPVITNNEIAYNGSSSSYGAAIYTHNAGTPIIRGNYIHHNKMGAINCWNGSLIENNVIAFNEHPEGSAINIIFSEPVIRNNLIINNTGTPIYMRTGSEPTFINNVICNNQGDWVIDVSSYNNPTFVNNTICNNTTYNSCAVFLGESSQTTFLNNLVWGNKLSNGSTTNSIFSQRNNLSEIRNCLLQGGTDGIITDSFQGVIENILDSLPHFAKPTDGAGLSYPGDSADWSLLSISPAIDAGITEPPVLDFPVLDFDGEVRVFNETIDIGAIENRNEMFTVTRHPSNHILCENEPVSFHVEVSDTVFYQWQKDDTNIPDATMPTYHIDSATVADQGNYHCILTNSYGQVISNPAYLLVNERPYFLSNLQDTWAEKNETVILKTYAKGSNPSFQWLKDQVEIEGAISPELHIQNADYHDEGIYQSIVKNICGSDTTNPANLFLAPQICMVTVSSTTGHNLVVWEKNTVAPVLAYNLYRESEAAGIYDLLVSQPYDELSVFVDTTADPTVQAYLYKITALDTAEVETDIDLCKPHKTIHLLVTTNPELNTTQLAWDRYYGFDYQTYTIYRSNTGVNFDPIHSMSASLNSWTDPDPSDDDLFYRIAVEKPIPCEPEGTGKKAGTGPYRHSLSNMDNNKLKVGQMPPDTITISNNSIEEEKLPATMIGKLITADEDSIDAHTYQFVPGVGDNDNLSFTLLGDLLLASESFDYETKSQYSIRIRSTDQAGNYCEVHFIILIIDVDETTGLPVLNNGAVKAIPNPFTHLTTITFPNPSGESYQMILTDLSGKVIMIINDITTSEIVLNYHGLTKGLYFIELRGSTFYREKLIKE